MIRTSYNHFNPPKSKQLRVIDANEVKRLASQGLNKQQIAKALKMANGWFSKKPNNSLTLQTAFEEGKEIFDSQDYGLPLFDEHLDAMKEVLKKAFEKIRTKDY